jgi:putative NADPH-quinone reductase
MGRRVLILDGHPDPSNDRFVHALTAAYRQGAEEARHEVHTLRLADLRFPLLRTQRDYEKGEPTEVVRHCQDVMDWAEHVVIAYPLWLGGMPALLKALLEQVLRPGFAFSSPELGKSPVKFQHGKSGRVLVTMGMPALAYRWYYRAHSLRTLERNILRFVGFTRIRSTLIGSIANLREAERTTWIDRVRDLGRSAA